MAPDHLHYGEPVCLSAGMVLEPGAVGAPNVIALRNISALPLEIHEIQFTSQATSTGFAFGNTGGLIGGAIDCNMAIGDIPITNGFVPIWNFGKASNLVVENLVQVGVGNAYVTNYNEYTWRLATPLVIDPNSLVTPVFRHRNLIPLPITLTITFKGRIIAPIQKRSRIVPWVSCYISKAFDFQNNSTDTEFSSEENLVNPFTIPVQVNRFVGRMLRSANLYGTAVPNNEDDAGYIGSLLNVSIVDSYGAAIVADDTPFALVFDSATRSWETNFVMQPSVYYRVKTTQAGGPFNLGGGVATVQAFISVVGEREVVW